MKALGNPPQQVAQLCGVIAMILGDSTKIGTWRESQKMMANPRKFLDRLV